MYPEILTFWYFKDESWGRLIPERECWAGDPHVRRLSEVITPVPEHVVVVLIIHCVS
jgi:hypothetical protein